MKKFVLLLLTICFTLLGSLLPFNIVSANGSLSAPFVGYNVYLVTENGSYSSDYVSVNLDLSDLRLYCARYSNNACALYENWYENSNTQYGDLVGSITPSVSYFVNNSVYHVDLVLDNYYVGSVSIKINNVSNTYYVNGNHLEFNVTTNANLSVSSFTINSYSLNLIPEGKDWAFPIESFNFCSQQLSYNSDKLRGITSYNNYQFPIFDLVADDILLRWRLGSGATLTMVMFHDNAISNASGINSFFDISSSDISMTYSGAINYSQYAINAVRGRISKFTITNNGSANTDFYIRAKLPITIMPIYVNQNPNPYISTDFALNFGLSNSLLDNLNIIANGNSSSNSSVSGADQINNQASSTFDQEEQLINNAENDLSNKLNNLNIQNQNNNLFGNSKFISSASWVKTQFDRLTTNNAYGYLITFSLVIGISLVIIGKLRG